MSSKRRSFDIIFMDMHMPEMDGLETTAKIRDTEAGTSRRTPIVAMTANAGEGAREQCLQAGMNAYVSKPIEDRELFDVIAAVVPTAAKPSQPPPDTKPAPCVAPASRKPRGAAWPGRRQPRHAAQADLHVPPGFDADHEIIRSSAGKERLPRKFITWPTPSRE